jgi:hypothetical protein
VVYQTKNNHPTNLRDDIDRAINAVEALGHDVRGIRTDLAAEEDRRRNQAGVGREWAKCFHTGDCTPSGH